MRGRMGRRGTPLYTVAVVMLALSAGAAAALVAGTDAASRYTDLEELPTSAADVGDIDATAIDLAVFLQAVPVSADAPGEACPRERLRVSWEEPAGYEVGAAITPIGPPPDPGTDQVNGVVVCEGSTYAFMGFEAAHGAEGWQVTAVPSYVEAELEVGAEQLPELRALEGIEGVGDLDDLGPVDTYAPYQPQRLCDPDPKPGTVALVRLLLTNYRETASFGITRPCDLGARSEHKEGRAFDWGAAVTDETQRTAVEDFLSRLLATDEDGHAHALARRMGVMYLIWNGHIWSSYRADEGWRPYVGPSSHRDHVHLSLSWDGATGRTSLWQVALEDDDWRLLAASDGPLPAGRVSTPLGDLDGPRLPTDRPALVPDDRDDTETPGEEDSGVAEEGADGGAGEDSSDGTTQDLTGDVTGDVEDAVEEGLEETEELGSETPLPTPTLPAVTDTPLEDPVAELDDAAGDVGGAGDGLG